VLANGTNGRLEHRLWALDRPRQYLGWHAGGGLGYGVGASIGVALAQEPGVVTVDVQADGDLLFLPSALWTAAHLGLPILIVVHDNRQYGNTVEHAAAIARHRGRTADRRYAGRGWTTRPWISRRSPPPSASGRPAPSPIPPRSPTAWPRPSRSSAAGVPRSSTS
jgi:hypothetical protein